MLINSGYSVIITDVLTPSDAHGCPEELITIPAILRDRTLIILSYASTLFINIINEILIIFFRIV